MKRNASNPKRPFAFITKYFLEGLFVLLPLTLTIASVLWLAGFFSRQLGPKTIIGSYLKELGFKVAGDSPLAYGIGWIVVFIFIILLGFLVDTGARKYIRRIIDSIMQKIPLINKVYRTSVQVVDMINTSGRDEFHGMSVVYCTFGEDRGATFIALMPNVKTYRVREKDHYMVIIPTAPVPMGGGLMLVPADSVQPAEMSIEDFMQMYVSMGAVGDTLLPGRSDKK